MRIDKNNEPENLGKIVDYLAGEVSVEERRNLEVWLNEDPAHKTFFKKMKRVWQASEMACEKFCPNIDYAWEKVKQANEEAVKPLVVAGKGASKKQQNVLFYVAASVAVVVALGIGWLSLTQDHFMQKVASQKEKVEANQRGKVVLADGSEVWLNSHASLYYPNTFDKERKVYLEGEAYFEIAKDADRPFVIYTGDGVTEVLGTAFNLNADKETVVVTVTRGQVALYPEGRREKKVVLEKGERGLFLSKNNKISKTKNTDINFLSWRTGVLTFEDAPLATVAAALSRHYQVAITLGEGISNHCRLTSTFKDKSLDEVLELINLTLDIEVKKEDEHFVMVGKGC